MGKECSSCHKRQGFASKGFGGKTLVIVGGKELCSECAKLFIDEATSQIIMTTTNNIDGHSVSEYLGIESVEIVMGTGVISEFGGEISDFFGARSTAFEQKLQRAKQLALKKLKFLAYERKANAVIGVDIDYTEFSGNRIGLIANGTLVRIKVI